MKWLKPITLEGVLMTVTSPLWVPAMIVGIVVGIIITGFLHGVHLIRGE